MKLFLLLTFLCGIAQGWSQDTLNFKNAELLSDYAFGNSNFGNFPSAYFINRTMGIEESDYARYLHTDTNMVTGKQNIHLLGLLQFWDTRKITHRDTTLFKAFRHFYTLDEERPLHIPLYVYDLDAVALNSTVWSDFTKERSTTEPFPAIANSDLEIKHFQTASIFLDSFAYNNVYVDFDNANFFSNRNKNVSEIILSSNGQQKHLYPGSSVEIADWLGGVREIELTIVFEDGTSFTKRQSIEMNYRNKTKSLPTGVFTVFQSEYYDSNLPIGEDNPEAKMSTWYACADHKIRKPFLMINGWGPHTDRVLINEDQNWPTPMHALAAQANQEGLLEDLHANGFDIITVQFFPPNASIIKNSKVLEKVINRINNLKYQNGSYEENIIMGFSAGSLATKLTLQSMEKKHLENNGPHPHTKLYISNDGEHQGANVPLGMQHAVDYLHSFEMAPHPSDIPIYALHYILNAPLSRELVHYFHTATGDADNPGQGPSNERINYLGYSASRNHSMNQNNLNYPSFTRNISISNGSSTPRYDFSNYTSDQYPFPSETGAVFFKQNATPLGWINRRVEATFLKHGVHRPFYVEYKIPFVPWGVMYEVTTKDPIVVDNAPGGLIFIRVNPIINVNKELARELPGPSQIEEDHFYAFTPTVFTHDIKNLNLYLNQGYPDYDFKDRGLMYQHEADVFNGVASASNFYGYPHLKFADHYLITPFDALFTWDQNTEHLVGDRLSNDYYIGEWCEMKPVRKQFITTEAEAHDIFLQNRRIGHYARPDFVYRVDYEALHGIYLGSHVTQKTDFFEMTSEPNAVVEAQAATEIHFKAGVHLKAGTTFHAFIGDITCEKSSQYYSSDNDNADTEYGISGQERDMAEQKPFIYPNPNTGSFSIDWKDIGAEDPLAVSIADLSGKVVLTTETTKDRQILHGLSPGIYIVKIIKKDVWHSQRIFVE